MTLLVCQSCGLSPHAGPCQPEPSPFPGETAPLPTGFPVGEYRVVRPLGAGGMGVVYEGLHPLLGRPVAIKIISQAAGASDELAERFLREARAASGLRHRNIVDVFAFGRLPDGRPYQVMELLEGDTLRGLIDRCAPLPLPLIHAVARGVLSALKAAERRGMVHRDIKPENIFVTGDPAGPADELEIKVLDFGLVKILHGAGAGWKTRTGVPMGTAAYMSPEQCRAAGPVDGRTDLYAVGIVLFEMLTGAVPFDADSVVEIMIQQMRHPPPPPSSIARVPRAVEAVVMRALAKQPEDRFANAAEMLAALHSAMAGVAPTLVVSDESGPVAVVPPLPPLRDSQPIVGAPAHPPAPAGLAGYRVGAPLHRGPRSAIDEGTRASDGGAVVIKRPSSEYPDAQALARFRTEQEILRRIASEYVLPPELAGTHHSRPFLIFPRFEGRPFSELDRQGWPLERLLALMALAARALGTVHDARVVHRDLDASNILVDAELRSLRIIDFASAALVGTERLEPRAPAAGESRHLAPEALGLFNRTIDHRADLYALGAAFYRLVAGVPLFAPVPDAEVPGQLLGLVPEVPEDRRRELPSAVVDIVLKLLEKEPDDRYQSAGSLLRDLECCLDGARAGAVAPFPLGQHDASDRFAAAGRLYGRRQQTAALLAAAGRAAAGPRRVVILSGPSGIGKSALVDELHGPLMAAGGHCVSGTCDRLERSIPYAPFAQALRELVPQLLAEEQAQPGLWRRRLEEEVGPGLRVLCDLAPELQELTGPLPPLPELEPRDMQIRFHEAVRRLLRLVATPQHPLVLFIDDLQWIATGDLALLRTLLLDSTLEHLLLVGAQRDGEVFPGHPLLPLWEELEKLGVAVQTLVLAPLGEKEIRALLADSFQHRHQELTPLARLLRQRTDGSPLFVREYLEHLAREGLIRFQHVSGSWAWNLARVEESRVPDSIAELLREKILNTPLATRNVLQAAACVGARFDVATVALVTGLDTEALVNHLFIALEEGLIGPGGAADHSEEEADAGRLAFVFSHERVHAAAYDLIPERERQRVHLQMARALLRAGGADLARSDRLLEIVTHFDKGWDLVEDAEERMTGLRLSLRAAGLAKGRAAPDVASRYLRRAVEQLPDEAWRNAYELTSDLHLERAECEYLVGRRDLAEEIIGVALDHVVDPIDRATAHGIDVAIKTNKGRPQEAIRIGVGALAELGIEVQPSPPRHVVTAAILEARRRLESVSTASLLELGRLEDPRTLAILRLINRMGPSTYFVDLALYVLLHCWVLRLALDKGHAPESVRGYSVFGMILGSDFRLYSEGERFGELAIELSDRLDSAHMKGVSRALHGCFISHWTRTIDQSLARLADAHEHLQEAGDLVLGSFALCFHAAALWTKGEPLARVGAEADSHLRYLRQAKYREMVVFMDCLRRSVACLDGSADSPVNLDGGGFVEAEALAQMRRQDIKTPLHFYYILKMNLHYLAGELEEAAQVAELSGQLMNGSRGALYTAEHVFLSALVAIGRRRAGGPLEEQCWTLSMWANTCRENFMAMHLLVEAELAGRIEDRHERAPGFYQSAFEIARDQQNLKVEALACELAGRYHLDRGNGAEAARYLTHAHYAYGLWGATSKARALRERHRALFASAAERGGPKSLLL